MGGGAVEEMCSVGEAKKRFYGAGRFKVVQTSDVVFS